MKKWVKVVFRESKDDTASLSFNYEKAENIEDGHGTSLGVQFSGCNLYANDAEAKRLGVDTVTIEVPNGNVAYIVYAEVPDDSVA